MRLAGVWVFAVSALRNIFIFLSLMWNLYITVSKDPMVRMRIFDSLDVSLTHLLRQVYSRRRSDLCGVSVVCIVLVRVLCVLALVSFGVFVCLFV